MLLAIIRAPLNQLSINYFKPKFDYQQGSAIILLKLPVAAEFSKKRFEHEREKTIINKTMYEKFCG